MSSTNDLTLYIGLFAGICTAMSLLPQLVKIIRDKKANAISYGMLSILMVGLIGWIVYGSLRSDYPIILTNCGSLILNILIVIFTIKYKTRST
jgi:MtN3 and saliva related transmembrane protein